jgi:4-hydroxy-3-methylbut-2-enyl diphosphate reductase
MIKNIIIAKHHGFCMGVKRAINTAEKTASEESGKVTILNEIVHNEAVVEKFKEQGVAQSSTVDEVDQGTLIISAHGIAPNVIKEAEAKGLKVVDATCPLVTRIYDIIKKAVSAGFHIIHYGNPHHDETKGIVGYAPDNITVASNIEELLSLPEWKERKLGLTVQTTAHIDEFNDVMKLAKNKWPHLEVFDTICNATTQRQSAIYELAPMVDMILVVGSETSANSRRLADISNDICGNGKLIGTASDIVDSWFDDDRTKDIGISAGASTPDFLVTQVIEHLMKLSGSTAEVIDLNAKRAKTY